MITNSQTNLGLLLSGSCVVLALAAWLMCSWSLLFRKAERTPEFHRQLLYLDVLLTSLTILSLVAWPQFYLTLRSYVSELAVQGVMCVYGVTQLSSVVGWVELGFPLMLWSLGLCWWLGNGYRIPGAINLYYLRLAVGWLASLLSIATYGGVLFYLTSSKGKQHVTCCTQFAAVDSITAPQASAFETLRASCAPGFDRYSLIIFCALNLALGIWLYRRSKFYQRQLPSGKELLAISVVAISNLALNGFIWPESIAPYVLKLPYHHCAYELLTDTWALGLAAACAVIGNLGLLWPMALFLLPSSQSVKRLLVHQSTEFCSIAILSETIILTIQVA